MIDPKREPLKVAYANFMEELHKDLQDYLPKETPFVCKVDIHLGAQEEHRDKVMNYGNILKEIMDTVPSQRFIEKKKNEDK